MFHLIDKVKLLSCWWLKTKHANIAIACLSKFCNLTSYFLQFHFCFCCVCVFGCRYFYILLLHSYVRGETLLQIINI